MNIFIMSVHLPVWVEQLCSHWMDFHEIWYLRIFKKSVTTVQVSLQLNKSKGYFTWGPIYIFLIISPSFLLKWETFQTKVAEKIKTHILRSVTFIENRAIHEVMWKNIVEWGRPQMKIWRMLDTQGYKYTYSGSVILTAFPLQHLLHEHASVLHYIYTDCLVLFHCHLYCLFVSPLPFPLLFTILLLFFFPLMFPAISFSYSFLPCPSSTTQDTSTLIPLHLGLVLRDYPPLYFSVTELFSVLISFLF
jgi:hypothetical protein